MTDDTALDVHPSNADQFRGWDGEGGDFWVERADRFDEGMAAYHGRFLAAAAIGGTDTVLDIGCGNGKVTRDAARAAADGSVLGVDLSSAMLAHARALAERERLTNVTFRQADAQVHPFPEARFDVAVSRNGTMFFGDPLAAFGNIARAIRPGGRLVLLTWQPVARNPWLTDFRTALAAGRELPPMPTTSGPFSLSDPDRVRDLLTSAGFTGVELNSLTGPMYYGADPDDACAFVSAHYYGLLTDLDDDTRARALGDLRARLAAHQTERGVCYDSATWLVRARRA